MYRSIDWPLSVSKHARQTCTRWHGTLIQRLHDDIKADDTCACRERSTTMLAGKLLTFTGTLNRVSSLVTELIDR